MEEIATNDYNLNISRYISTAQREAEIDLASSTPPESGSRNW
jgi:type I restriction enzyme M protein